MDGGWDWSFFFLREHELKRWDFWVNNHILPNLPMSSVLNYVDNPAVLMIVVVYEDPSCDSKRIGWNHQPETRVESKHWDPGVWLFRTWVEWNKHVCVCCKYDISILPVWFGSVFVRLWKSVSWVCVIMFTTVSTPAPAYACMRAQGMHLEVACENEQWTSAARMIAGDTTCWNRNADLA